MIHPMQTTLLHFNLYEDLKASGYVDNKKLAVLLLLADGKWHSTDEVLQVGGKQYNRWINDLRDDGYTIESSYHNNKYGNRLVEIRQRFNE